MNIFAVCWTSSKDIAWEPGHCLARPEAEAVLSKSSVDHLTLKLGVTNADGE